jgi:nucleoside-diphosphate-sugar epimerase
MRILVFGASGFLGCHLIPLLDDHDVIAVSRRPRSGGGSVAPRHREWIQLDLSSDLDVERLPATIDAIIFLAQSDRYRDGAEGASDMFRINVEAPARLFNWGAANGVRNVVIASTGSVYEPFTGSMREDAALAPTGFYGASKLAAEILATPWQSRLDVAILRLFSLYGPGQGKSFISRTLEAVQRGNGVGLPVEGDGLVFAPTYVEDAARVFKQALQEGWKGVWNVASKETVSLREFALEIGRILGKEPKFERSDRFVPQTIVPDLSKLAGRLDLSTFLSLEAGLKRTLAVV